MKISLIFIVLAVLMFVLLFMIIFKRALGNVGAKKISQSSVEKFNTVRCFNCDSTMEQGFVNVLGSIRWRDADSPVPKTSSYGEQLKNLSTDQVSQLMTFGLPEHRALRCKMCDILTIDHGKIYKLK